MLNVRQMHGKYSDTKMQQLIYAALQQEIFSYFESSDKTTKWLGIGSTLRISPDQNSNYLQKVSQWFDDIKRQIPDKIDLDTIAVLGGFPFDEKFEAKSLFKDWQTGIFVLPRIIMKVTPEQTVITEIKLHKFSEDSLESVLDTIIELATSDKKMTGFDLVDLDPKWDRQVDKLATEIKQSTSLKKVVLGRYKKGTIIGELDWYKTLKALRALNQTTYHFMMRVKDQCFVSATPERLFKIDGTQFSTAAVAGTIGRGNSETEDNRKALELFKDDKNRQEHQIVVDEIATRVSRFAENLQYQRQPMILKNQTVQHLYTPISAQVEPKTDVFKLISVMHPTPALGGLPLTSALHLIDRLESQGRALFGGPVGYITLANNSEMIVAIRSMYVYKTNFLMFAGAGIMPDSVGTTEFKETELKFQPMTKLLQYLEDK